MPTFVPSGILIHPTVWPQNTGCKLGAVPLWGGGAGSTSNTWPGPRPTSMPGFTVIHPTVWQQYSNITDRQTDGQDRQRIDSKARTVLQTVTQKFCQILWSLLLNFVTIFPQASAFKYVLPVLFCDSMCQYSILALFHAAGKFCEKQLKACSHSAILDMCTGSFLCIMSNQSPGNCCHQPKLCWSLGWTIFIYLLIPTAYNLAQPGWRQHLWSQ